jgi:hypothetical protein
VFRKTTLVGTQADTRRKKTNVGQSVQIHIVVVHFSVTSDKEGPGSENGSHAAGLTDDCGT